MNTDAGEFGTVMTAERYQQIDQIFQAALALEPDQRAAYLDEACSGDEPLRKQVESLITSDEGGLSFIDEPVRVAGQAFSQVTNLN